MEKALAGLPLFVAYHPDEIEICKVSLINYNDLDETESFMKKNDSIIFVRMSDMQATD